MAAPLRLTFSVFLISIFGLATGSVAQPVSPFVTADLGTLASGYSRAFFVNGRGQVVGSSVSAVGSDHAFIWTARAGMLDLGTLGGRVSQPTGVNRQGQVVGQSYIAGDIAIHAFSWTFEGGMVDLGVLGKNPFGGAAGSAATAVNNRGQVVGATTTAVVGDAAHAFSWIVGEGMLDLGTLGGGYSGAVDVNDNGQIVGSSEVHYGLGDYHAFLWAKTRGMVDLGTLGGFRSAAVAVNDRGQVMGWSEVVPRGVHAFSWTATGGMVDLGTFGSLDSEAVALNARGQVVGNAYAPGGRSPSQAFSWTPTGGIVDLGSLGPRQSEARDVNNDGQVVGTAYTADNELHGYSWTAADGMVDLGTLGGTYSIALAVNGFGQIVGGSATEGGSGFSEHASIWLDVEAATTKLEERVRSKLRSSGLKTTLSTRLRTAMAKWRAGATGAAVGQFQAFIAQVNAQRRKGLTDAQADTVVGIAETIAFAIRHGTVCD